VFKNEISNLDYAIIDYNFSLIPIFFGFFIIFKHLLSEEKYINRLFYNFLLLLFFLDIFMSSSRRGLILGVIILLLLFLIQLVSFFKKDSSVRKISKRSRSFIISIILVIFLTYLFFFLSSNEFKNRVLKIFSPEKVYVVKQQVTQKIYRNLNIFSADLDYLKLEEKLWGNDFNPLYPSSGWGYKGSKRLFPLTGKNSSILPEEAVGSLMDSSTFNFDSNKYTSFSRINTFKVNKGEKYKVSIYCYVSRDFNGAYVRLMLTWFNTPKKLQDIITFYNLKNKDIWQKLEIEFECHDGYAAPYLSITRKKEEGNERLQGYIIFAYPEIQRIETNENDIGIEESKISEYDMFLEEMNKEKHAMLNAQFVPGITLLFQNQQKDYIRNVVKKLINEDTTYYGYKADIKFNHDPKDVIHGRTDRWKFAWEIFTKEYNWTKKIFGGGFDHLNWYGYYFHNDKTRSDWPHNPFLSVLLYSGILGLALYLFVFYKAVYYYIKYIKEYYIFFIFFLITFFFSFFSADSPFNPPVMGFLLIFPFFLHSVLKKENIEKVIEKE